MVDIYFFKAIKEGNDDFYLRVAHDNKLSFITERDEHIFSTLNLVASFKSGEPIDGIMYKTIDIDMFITNRPWFVNPETKRKPIIINKDFMYSSDKSSIYVTGDHYFTFKDNVLKVEYYYIDSDRHKEKDEIEFDIDIEEGINSTNSEHFFYVRKDIFKNFEITKL